MESLSQFLGFMLIVFLIYFIILLIAFICQGIGLYHISDKLEKDNRWMAFVPILNVFLIGRCVDEENPVILHMGWVACLLNLVLSIAAKDYGIIILLGWICYMAIRLFYIYQISVKLHYSGIIQAVLSFFGLGAFVYLYLGLKTKEEPEGQNEQKEENTEEVC